MFTKWFLLMTVLFSNSIPMLFGSKILAVMPVGARSHYRIFITLLTELANRGHEITFLSPFTETDLKVIRFIDISGGSTMFVDSLPVAEVKGFDSEVNDFVRIYNNVFEFNEFIKNVTVLHRTKEVMELLKSDRETFDLVIIELFNSDADYLFGYKFKAPVISITTCPLVPWGYDRFANPSNPSYIRHVFSSHRHPMNFWGRLINTVELLAYKTAHNFMFLPSSQEIVSSQYKNAPQLEELIGNTALLLSNTHHSLHGAKPNVPNVIEIGGIHVKPSMKLPKELQTFIDGAEYGVIYFCMGSMLRASTIPDEKRDALVRTFARLRQKVLWKWEDDTMPGKSDNVKLVKWMPQRDILAHPNVKLFISHGGLLGTTEAVHCGVPIIGIPFYGDQAGNIEAVASHGAGLRLDYNDINEQNLYNKITEILNNPQYAENAKSLSERFRDRPQTPLETAVYWTEYVIRHKGAPHLRSAAVDLTWYQYLLIDVIAFITFVFATATLIIYYSLKFVLSRLFRRNQKSKKASQTKAKKS